MSTDVVSVVIASKNRRELLRGALRNLRDEIDALSQPVEVIVVDDGSSPPYEPSDFAGVTMIRGRGEGPAMARNRGVRQSTGNIVFFTDDDARVEPGWFDAALGFLRTHPQFAGVTGATRSPEFNAIYEHSVEDHVGGSYLTCNIAYRRGALETVGGFDRLFAHAHEDRDLAWRVAQTVGPVGFEPTMRVVHPGRPFTVRSAWRRATFTYDDWLLFARYPTRRAGRASIRWTPLRNTVRTWRNVGVKQHIWRHPRQFLRWSAVSAGQISYCAVISLWRWRSVSDRDIRVVPGLGHGSRRIAYVGPSPHPQAPGAPGVAGLLLNELLKRGYSIDCYVAASREDDDPRALGDREGLSYIVGRSGFAFGRWYSRHRLSKMISLQLFAGVNRRRLARRLSATHKASPYDFVYQFSTFESVGVPRRRDLPVIIHPSVHAAGERRWLLSEAGSALSADSTARIRFVATWLAIRSWRQRRDARAARGILALGEPFAAEIARDYGVSSQHIRVVPNCIDVHALARHDPSSRELVVVGRLAVRKGLEDVVELSHRLSGIDPTVRLRIIGAPSLWSDYRLALESCDSAVTSIDGGRTRAEVFEDVAGSLALLQLSRYEPFALTVAEALALGVPVIVTAAVGAAVHVASDVKIVVAPGDLDALAEAVRSLSELRLDERTLLSHRCRHEAERLFTPEVVADQFETAINELLA